MEKQTPHCKLSIVKAMIEAGAVRSTKSAREGAAALGFDFDTAVRWINVGWIRSDSDNPPPTE